MTKPTDYNSKGSLLEELAGIQDTLKHKTRLFEVMQDIRGFIVTLYPNPDNVGKLEETLADYEGLPRRELELLSRGVKVELRQILEQVPDYSPDTVNQVFIALYGLLLGTINGRDLPHVVNYSRGDNINPDVAEIIGHLNIYDVLANWVTRNNREIGGLSQPQTEVATLQFRDLKKSAREFVHTFRILLRQIYNIETAYKHFTTKRNWVTYKSARKVVEATVEDCADISKAGDSIIERKGKEIISRFTHAIHLNAQYFFLQMGYEMLTDQAARSTIQDLERFKGELARTAFDATKITYFSVVPNGDINVDGLVNRLSPDVRKFYLELKAK